MTTSETDTLPNGRRIRAVFAEPTADGHSLRFWCPWCDKWHRHGRPTPGTDETPYRVAHCIAEDSPLRQADYRLVEIESAPIPRRRFPIRYTRDGRILSGFRGMRPR